MRALGAFAAFLVVFASAAAFTRPPSLLVYSGPHPFIVLGRHFNPRERVRVTLTGSHTFERRTTLVNPLGRFEVPFVPVAHCAGWVFTLRAFGSSGDGATLKHTKIPDCTA